MIPIIFEITAGPVPRRILRRTWERIAGTYPEECGHVIVEDPTPEGIERVTLGVPERELAYVALLDALTAIDVWTRMRWSFPPLLSHAASVQYHPEPPGSEVWASTAALFLRGKGDCEDLACDVAATYQLDGIAARAMLQLEELRPTADMWHVVVELPDGSIEDPSAALGMRQ